MKIKSYSRKKQGYRT
jgi:hypothetical protein